MFLILFFKVSGGTLVSIRENLYFSSLLNACGGGTSMKKLWILWLMYMVGMPVMAQNIVYSNLKELLSQEGDTVKTLEVEKRSKNQIVLTGGADYRIVAGDDESMCNYLKKRCYAVRVDSALYINCKRLRYNKLRFGNWYAPVIQINRALFFSAMPVGSIAAPSDAAMDVKLGGAIGGALEASGLVTHRVYYVIDGETGKIEFLGKEQMLRLLEKYPQWQEEYLKENSKEAEVTKKYLLLLTGGLHYSK